MPRLAIKRLRRDEAGATIIEMAVALPVLIFIIYGIFESAMLFQANAGMQHAIGEGARLATIYPTPSDSTVQTKVNDSLFGTEAAKSGFPTVSVTSDNATNPKSKTISITFKKDVNFLFLTTREITLTRSKKVYVAQ